jgi:AhpD family alkylhydroperoxidase
VSFSTSFGETNMQAIAPSVFTVPARESVSAVNQSLFDKLLKGVGMVPNLYATFAHSETALGDYLALQGRKTSLTLKEKEVVNLVVSQVNECEYCLAAHTVLGQKAGFTADEVLAIRRGESVGHERLDLLARFVKAVAETRGRDVQGELAALLDAGFTRENVVDIVVAVGDKTITNLLHNVTRVEVDFPAAPSIAD